MTQRLRLLVEGGRLLAVNIAMEQFGQDQFGNLLLAPACTSFADLDRHVNELISELREIRQAARQKFIEAGQARNKKTKGKHRVHPERSRRTR